MDYSSAAWEQAMRMQDVILRAMSGEISWFAAADILQMTPRNLRRWRERYERWGYNGLVDQRRCPSKRRVPLAELERVLRLYRERYAGFNGRHFHEIVRREHGVTLSYSYVKQALQQAGLLPTRKPRGRHRRRREPRACFGELLHLDGSRHPWLALVPDARATLITIVDDATSALLYAQLWAQETMLAVMSAPRPGHSHRRPADGALHRSGRLGVLHAQGDRSRGQDTAHASRPRVAPAGHRAHSGVLAAGARAQ